MFGGKLLGLRIARCAYAIRSFFEIVSRPPEL